MKSRFAAGTILVLALGVAAGGLMAQPPDAPKKPMPMMGDKTMDECKAMMAKHEAMKAEMASMDAKLDSLVAAMNSATGSQKVEATAAVVTEMATQRKAMREHMMAMGPQMMQHMMRHGHMGTMEGMKGMPDCPMMQPSKPEGAEPPKHH
jgi:hypothetical protein